MAPTATTPLPAPVADISNLKAQQTKLVGDSAALFNEQLHSKNSTLDKRSRTAFPRPPQFDDKLEERAYLKFRLAQAFRIFGKLGYDEGVAGHITVRVCMLLKYWLICCETEFSGPHFATV